MPSMVSCIWFSLRFFTSAAWQPGIRRRCLARLWSVWLSSFYRDPAGMTSKPS